MNTLLRWLGILPPRYSGPLEGWSSVYTMGDGRVYLFVMADRFKVIVPMAPEQAEIHAECFLEMAAKARTERASRA